MLSRAIERVLFASRWLLAPFYIGLAVGLVALLVKAGQHVVHLAETLLSTEESDVVLGILGLIDLTLTASLVLLIMFAGYENFVTKIKGPEDSNWPVWMTKIDFTGLKLKLLASIVSISAIQLLRAFMNISNLSDRELWWSTGIHLTFVVSLVLLAVMDRFSDEGHGGGEH